MQKPNIQTIGKGKKIFFNFFNSDIPNFFSMGFFRKCLMFRRSILLIVLHITNSKITFYGFSLNALRLINSYLSDKGQRTKINESYSSWKKSLFGVPQGSFLCSLLGLSFIVNEIDFASYADHNAPIVSDSRLNYVLNSLEKASSKLSDSFTNNQIRANTDPCDPLTSATTSIAIRIKFNEILNSESEKLLVRQ